MGKGREGAIKCFVCRPIVWNADAQRVGGRTSKTRRNALIGKSAGNCRKAETLKADFPDYWPQCYGSTCDASIDQSGLMQTFLCSQPRAGFGARRVKRRRKIRQPRVKE